MRMEQLPTPALAVDLGLLEQNLERMSRMAREAGIALRPHYKTHKCTTVAHLQIKAGAKGICCAKLGEAVDLCEAGIEDILIANEITDPAKLARVASLANCCRLTVCVDSADGVAALEAAAAAQNATVYVLVEYNVGHNRCGVGDPKAAYALARQVADCDHLVFEGVQAYAGHLSHERDYDKRRLESDRVEARLRELVAHLTAQGLPVNEVSGSSTGTVGFRQKGSVYTELQAGSYVYMDAAYGLLELGFHNALFVVTSVMSTAGGTVLCDAGIKAVSADQTPPHFADWPDLPLVVSEEHCQVRTALPNVAVGDRLRVIPGHCCTTVNLHDSLYLLRDGKVVDRVPVSSRGKSW